MKKIINKIKRTGAACLRAVAFCAVLFVVGSVWAETPTATATGAAWSAQSFTPAWSSGDSAELVFNSAVSVWAEEAVTVNELTISGTAAATLSGSITATSTTISTPTTISSAVTPGTTTLSGDGTLTVDATTSFTAVAGTKALLQTGLNDQAVTVKGSGDNGIDLTLDGATTFTSHIVLDGGKHIFRLNNGNGGYDVCTNSSNDDPMWLIKNGTELTFYGKDFGGWGGGNKAATCVVAVENGGTLKLANFNNKNTFFALNRWYLNPGATMTVNTGASYFCVIGGSAEGQEQFYMPASESGTANINGTGDIRLFQNNTKGAGFFVGEGSTLNVSNKIYTDDANEPLVKRGAGTLVLNGDIASVKGAVTLAAGTTKIGAGTWFAGNVTLNSGATLEFAPSAATTYTLDSTKTTLSGTVTVGANATIALGACRPTGTLDFGSNGGKLTVKYASTDETTFSVNVSGITTSDVTVYKADGTTVDSSATKTIENGVLTVSASTYTIPAETTASSLADLQTALSIPATGDYSLVTDHNVTITATAEQIAAVSSTMTISTQNGAVVTIKAQDAISPTFAGTYVVQYDIYQFKDSPIAIAGNAGFTTEITNSEPETYTDAYTGTITATANTLVKVIASGKFSSVSVPSNGNLEIAAGTMTITNSGRGLSGNVIVDENATLALYGGDIINYNGFQSLTVKGTLDCGAYRQSIPSGASIVIYSGATVTGSGDNNNSNDSSFDYFENNTKTVFKHAEDTSSDTVTFNAPIALRGSSSVTWTIDENVTVDWNGAAGKGCVSSKASATSGTLVKAGAGTLNLNAAMNRGTLDLSAGKVNIGSTMPVNMKITGADASLTASDSVEVTGAILLGSSATELVSGTSNDVRTFLTGDKWKGTLTIPSHTADNAARQIPLMNYGNRNSVIVLNGLSGSTHWINGDNTSILSEVKIAGDVTFNNGSNNKTIYFRKLSGTDSEKTFAFASWADNVSQTYVIDELDFAGSLALTGSANAGTTCKMIITNIVKETWSYGTPLVTCTVTKGTSGAASIEAVKLNGAETPIVYATYSDNTGLFAVAAQYNSENYYTLADALTAATTAENYGSIVVYDYASDSVPEGYGLERQNDGTFKLVATDEDWAKSNTWTDATGDHKWTTAGNWAKVSVPTSATAVTFPAGEWTVYVGHGTDDAGICSTLEVDGNLTLCANDDMTDYGGVNIYGTSVTGSGTITLKRAGFWTHNSETVTIAPDIIVDNNGSNDSFLAQGASTGCGGYTVTGKVTGSGYLQFWQAVALDGGIEVTGSNTLKIKPSNNNTATIGNTVVSGTATLTIQTDVTLGTGESLTVEDEASVSIGTAGDARWFFINGGTVNLDGGSLNVCRIRTTADTGYLNFDGGRLASYNAGNNRDNILCTGDNIVITVKAGGATIDVPSDLNTTISQVLAGDAESTGGALTKTGTGTLTLAQAPTVTGGVSLEGGSIVIPNEYTSVTAPSTKVLSSSAGDTATTWTITGNAVASVDDVGYATLTEAITAAGSDKVITLYANIAEAITLASGATLKIAFGEYAIGEGGSIDPASGETLASFVKDGVTTYVSSDNTASIWTNATEDGAWATAGNWSTAQVPTSSTVVTFNNGATVTVSGANGACAGMVVDGEVSINTESATQTREIELHGNVTGEGTLTLNRICLGNKSDVDITVAPAIKFTNYNEIAGRNSNTHKVTLTGAVEISGTVKTWNTVHHVTGAAIIKSDATFQAGSGAALVFINSVTVEGAFTVDGSATGLDATTATVVLANSTATLTDSRGTKIDISKVSTSVDGSYIKLTDSVYSVDAMTIDEDVGEKVDGVLVVTNGTKAVAVPATISKLVIAIANKEGVVKLDSTVSVTTEKIKVYATDGSGNKTTTDITAAFKVTAGENNTYTVELNDAATVGGVKVAAEVDTDATKPFDLSTTDVGLTMKTIPGLWYGMAASDTPNGTYTVQNGEDAVKQATDSSLTLSVALDSEATVKFYRVKTGASKAALDAEKAPTP